MDPIKIGNWLITKDGIEWTGRLQNGYNIDKSRLAESGHDKQKDCYDWLLHLPEKNWVTTADVYTLNTAFLYALEIFRVPLNSLSFKNTLAEQQKILQFK